VGIACRFLPPIPGAAGAGPAGCEPGNDRLMRLSPAAHGKQNTASVHAPSVGRAFGLSSRVATHLRLHRSHAAKKPTTALAARSPALTGHRELAKSPAASPPFRQPPSP